MNHPLGFKRISIAFEGDAAICTFKDKRLTEETNIQLLGEDFVRLINEFGQKAILLDFANVELLSSACAGQVNHFQSKCSEQWRQARSVSCVGYNSWVF